LQFNAEALPLEVVCIITTFVRAPYLARTLTEETMMMMALVSLHTLELAHAYHESRFGQQLFTESG
jgi:hypothetical protein